MKATRTSLLALSMLLIGLAVFPLNLSAQTARGERAFDRLSRQLELTPERATALKQNVKFADDATLWDVASDLRTHLTADEKAKLIAAAGTARGPRAAQERDGAERAVDGRRQGRRQAINGQRAAYQGRRMAVQGRRMAVQGRRMAMKGHRTTMQGRRMASKGQQAQVNERDANQLDRIPNLTPEQTARIEKIRTEAQAKSQEMRNAAREAATKRTEVREQLRTQTQEAVREVLTDEQKETLIIHQALTRSSRQRSRRM